MWRIGLIAALAATTITSCSEASSQQTDELTLAYLNAHVFPHGATSCKSAVVESRTYLGCRNVTLDGKSMIQLWLVNEQDKSPRYLALNGTAVSTYEHFLRGDQKLGEAPAPLPKGVAIEPALKAVD